MSLAAATGGGRRRERGQSQKRREMLKCQRKEQGQVASAAFAKLSPDGKTLPEEMVPEWLASVCNTPVEKLDSRAVQLVIDEAKRKVENAEVEHLSAVLGGIDEEALPRDILLVCVEKYAEYLAHSSEIDDIYERFEKNKDGFLSRRELQKCLQEYERKVDRCSEDGVVPIKLMVFEEDIDFILQQSDAAGNGKISKNEVLPALAAWEQLARVKVDEAESGCIVM